MTARPGPYLAVFLQSVPQCLPVLLGSIPPARLQGLRGLRAHRPCGRKEAWAAAVDLLAQVGIVNPERRAREERVAEGIPVAESLRREIEAIAASAGAAYLLS